MLLELTSSMIGPTIRLDGFQDSKFLKAPHHRGFLVLLLKTYVVVIKPIKIACAYSPYLNLLGTQQNR